jgi:hypothetical protein
MSNRENPGSGYVVKLDCLTAIIPEDDKKEIERLIEDESDGMAVCDLLDKIIPADMAKPTEVFCFSDEDVSQDPLMEHGEWYCLFEEDELYSRLEKDALKELQKVGINPELCHWSMWG